MSWKGRQGHNMKDPVTRLRFLNLFSAENAVIQMLFSQERDGQIYNLESSSHRLGGG